MSELITFDQLCALRDLERALVKEGRGGLGPEVQAIIDRYKDGRSKLKTNDIRFIQAKILWDKGVGRALGYKKFKDYLATIPEIPTALLADDPILPLLRLVDPRLDLSKSCELFGIKYKEFGYTDADCEAYDQRHEIPNTPFWVRAHDGRKNRNHKPVDCRKEATGKFYSMTAMVAIMVWVQDPTIIKEGEHIMDCSGSVHQSDRGHCAYLEVWRGEVGLGLRSVAGIAHPHCGSGVFCRE